MRPAAITGRVVPVRPAMQKRKPRMPVSRPATTAMAQNQTSAPMKARVSAFISWAVRC